MHAQTDLTVILFFKQIYIVHILWVMKHLNKEFSNIIMIRCYYTYVVVKGLLINTQCLYVCVSVGFWFWNRKCYVGQ